MNFRKIIAIAAVAAIAFIGTTDVSAKKQKANAEEADGYRLERAMGTVLGTALNRSVEQISSMGIKVDRENVIAAVLKVLDGKDTGFTLPEADALIGEYVDSVRREANKPYDEESQAEFLAKAALEPGATVMPSGLVFRIITEGEGAMPGDNDSVRLLYSGSLSNGGVFDSTDEPVVFTVQNLVLGFSEGLKMMKPGGIYEITFPAALGYGEGGIPGAIPGNAALKFRVELIEVLPPAADAAADAVAK
ncbi:MAG: FKBP-type peptidyl-prolyl cis-trans isomerase [Muribaculaceae bacterium]|nr:FKBP-type peptidyl-prolyl cis-trans isomerase [Muribaculaceae bacterium]